MSKLSEEVRDTKTLWEDVRFDWADRIAALEAELAEVLQEHQLLIGRIDMLREDKDRLKMEVEMLREKLRNNAEQQVQDSPS